MGYVLKEEIANLINQKYKNSYIANKLSLSGTYVSLILHRKKAVPKRLAYAFTKAINQNAEIEDMFKQIK